MPNESETEPDAQLHPQEYLEWQVDRLFEASDHAAHLIMEQIVERLTHKE